MSFCGLKKRAESRKWGVRSSRPYIKEGEQEPLVLDSLSRIGRYVSREAEPKIIPSLANNGTTYAMVKARRDGR
jgi:hypothetical protein